MSKIAVEGEWKCSICGSFVPPRGVHHCDGVPQSNEPNRERLEQLANRLERICDARGQSDESALRREAAYLRTVAVNTGILRGELAGLREQVKDFREVVNHDGSLETHEEHIDTLCDAMHYLRIAASLDDDRREIDSLRAQLAAARLSGGSADDR